MNYEKLPQLMLEMIFVLFLLVGCSTSASTLVPTAQPIQPPQPTGLPPQQPELGQPLGQPGPFKFIRTVQVTAAANSEAVSGYVHYVPQTDRLVVILGQHLDSPVTVNDGSEICTGRAFGYQEYTTDMQPTGKSGFLSCGHADMTSRIIGDNIYLVKNAGGPGWDGERLEKFDPVTWKRLAYADIPLFAPNEAGDGPTISFINGQIDVTGEYFPNGNPDGPRGSHHHFFTTDLKPLGKMILQPPQYPAHCPEVSMLQEPGGDILMFAATAYTGDLIMLRFDKAWNFKEQRKLKDKAFFPTGSVANGDLFYVAYTDTSHREGGRMYRNVRLAAYDTNWNTLQDIAVTDFVNTPDTYLDGESPWLQLHGNRLYVSYLASTLDPVTGKLIGGQAFVDIYELTPSSSPRMTPTEQSAQPVEPLQLFNFIRTVQVTPDDNFKNGSFARINYVPATDRFVVTFATRAGAQQSDCQGAGIAYQEYSTEMQATGKSGRIVWEPAGCMGGDWASVMIDNIYYLVGKAPNWQLSKFDAVSWKKLAGINIPLDIPRETAGDPMIAYVNGQLDISAQYDSPLALLTPPKGDPNPDAHTHHHFFSTDLKPLGKKILIDTQHICGSAMIFVDGIYYFISANDYPGDVIVMKYDKDWKYLGMKELRKQAHWSTGVVFDGRRFYLAYLDTSLRNNPGFFPVYPNVHLAAFDRDWNLVEDVAVTNNARSDNLMAGRPWVILHNNRLYVSYDIDTVDPTTHEEAFSWQTYVSIYELK